MPDFGAGLLRQAADAGATPVSEGLGLALEVEVADGEAVEVAVEVAEVEGELVGVALGVALIDPGPKLK
ncbi:MAG: hypothetical protein WCO24_05970 [Actinomycetes bacterium]